MICGRYYLGLDHIEETEKIRNAVFHVKSNQSGWAAIDELDEIAVHAVVYTDLERKDAAAVGRLYRDENHTDFWIDRLAVRENSRGNGYGDFLVRMLVDKGLMMGADCVLVDTPKECAQFFIKIGFHPTKREGLEENSQSILLEIRQNQICKACQQR